jgi:hypothetical protein
LNETVAATVVSPPRASHFLTDVILDSFNLSARELLEIEAVSDKLMSPTPIEYKSLEKLAGLTCNAGMQYLMLDKGWLVSLVINNPNLNPEVVSHFLLRIRRIKLARYPFDITQAFHDLARNKLVISDVTLFKQFWATAGVVKRSQVPTETLAGESLLYSSMDEYSMNKQGAAHAMSIETLMFILALVSKRDVSSINPSLFSLCETILEDRREEIRAWVEVNMPEYDGLPLSWIYEVLDLYV